MQPFGDRVLIRPTVEDRVRASGLVMPEGATEKPQSGVVVAVGPGILKGDERVPVDVQEGETVLYSKYGGTEIKVDGVDMVLVKEQDVFAKVV
jgi:chaperonin GroES